jgi:PilZ domain
VAAGRLTMGVLALGVTATAKEQHGAILQKGGAIMGLRRAAASVLGASADRPQPRFGVHAHGANDHLTPLARLPSTDGLSFDRFVSAETTSDYRRSRRSPVELPVTLLRSHGNPISSRTVEVGSGGMRVCCDRPLGIDELLSFELEAAGERVGGRARVLREHVSLTYALRFERLEPHASEALRRLAGA